MIEMTFLQHYQTGCWVWVAPEIAENPPEWLISNRIDVTGYEKGALHFDVEFGQITGSDWAEATKLIRTLEDAFYSVSEDLTDAAVEAFYDQISTTLVAQMRADHLVEEDPRLLVLPIRDAVPASA